MRGVTGGVGNRSEDFGAGGLTVMGGPQLVGKPGVLGLEIDCHITGNRAHEQIHLARRPRAPGSICRLLPGGNNMPAHQGDYFIPSVSGPAQSWPNSGKTARIQVPGLATSVSLEVMNSSSTGMPSLVLSMPRLIAGTISSGFVTRSP